MDKDDHDIEALNRIAQARLAEAKAEIERSWEKFEQGVPLDSEPAITRAASAGRRRRSVTAVPAEQALEAMQGPRNNLLPVSFLSLGAAVARAVAQVRVPRTNRIGTGFLCAPGLFITNHHVIGSPEDAASATITFDYVDDPSVRPSIFRLDPAACFFSDITTSRDFAIIAVGELVAGEHGIESFGFCPLSNANDKHAIGEFANIIQHPLGQEKQVVLQDNLIVGRGEMVLHYYADTQKASSGSCVLTNQWQAIALHHWGQAVKDLNEAHSYDPKSVNQGVRISQIVEFVEARLPTLGASERARLTQMLELGATTTPHAAARHGGIASVRTGGRPESLQTTASNSAKWTIPIEISVSIPGFAGDGGAAISISAAGVAGEAEAGLATTGEGYRPDFLVHHLIALPRMADELASEVVLLNEPEQHPSAKPGELQYRHFSIVMNKSRAFCFFAASNVDGASLFGINSNGVIRVYADEDEKDFRAKAESGAEAGGKWFSDARIAKANQTGDGWYTGKNRLLPREGTDDTTRFRAIADFDRGHTVRRTEPIWGTEQAGREANFQSHCMTNVLPQQPLFNQDKRRGDGQIDPGEEQRSWFGMEVAVLRAASDDNKKMNVFSGPIFKDSDPFYDEGKPNGGGKRQIPLSFWKIAVWEDGAALKAVAMKASQEWALAPLADPGAEALDHPDQLMLIGDFLTTVRSIAEETGIIFDPQVLEADIMKDRTADEIAALTFARFETMARPA